MGRESFTRRRGSTALPDELPPGISAAEVAAHAELQDRLGAAHAMAFPGPAAEGIAPLPTEALGFKLLPVTLGHIAILERIHSPLLRAVAFIRKCQGLTEAQIQKRAAKLPGGTAEEQVETFYVFTQAPEDLRRLLAQGREAFRSAAMAAVADRIRPSQFSELSFWAGAHFARSFITAVEYEAKLPDGSFPLPPASPGTGSAGG
jgi:hypothetical protein